MEDLTKGYMEQLNSLENLLLHELQDMYHAEQQLVKALPKVAKKANSPMLKNAVEEHLRQTEGHVNRLEQAFQILGQPAKGRKCKAMVGILDEAEETMKEKGRLKRWMRRSSCRHKKLNTMRSPVMEAWPNGRKGLDATTSRTSWAKLCRKRKRPTRN